MRYATRENRTDPAEVFQPNRLYSAHAVAYLTGTSIATINRRVQSGKLTPVGSEHLRRFRGAELLKVFCSARATGRKPGKKAAASQVAASNPTPAPDNVNP